MGRVVGSVRAFGSPPRPSEGLAKRNRAGLVIRGPQTYARREWFVSNGSTVAPAKHSSARDGKEFPGLRNPPELLGAPVLELEVGAGDEVVRGRGNEYLACSRASCDACPDVDRDAARLLRRHAFDFARMHAGAYVDTQLAHAGADFECTVDSAGGAVEQGHEAVTGGIDLLASEPFELTAHLG